METFNDRDLTGAEFRECSLDGVRMVGVVMRGAVIEGEVVDLVVNGVEVGAYVEAELDRRNPDRVLLRSEDPDELREGWRRLQVDWDATIERIGRKPGLERRSVNGEWAPIQTLRHLLFAGDAWFRRGVLGQETPYTSISLPGHWLAPGELPEVDAKVDADADPTWQEVLAVRRTHVAEYTHYLAAADVATLIAPGPAFQTEGWPAEAQVPRRIDGVRVVLEEEWWHHRYTVRDLDLLDEQGAT